MSLIPLRIGFIPLADCAPLVVAQELGIFEKHGLAVELRKANGWDQLVARLAASEVDAAHMLITLVLAHNATPSGWNHPFAYSACLSQHGNGITLSNGLWRAGVRDANGLAEYIRSHPDKPIRLGVVHPRSTHEYLLRHWLARGHIKPGHGVEFVHVPPPEMVRRLRTAEIDGFCVGEPWNQRAVTSKLGYLVALSTDLLPPMNEKVLAIRHKWHASNQAVHMAVIQAILEAAEWLNHAENRAQAVEWIASKRYVNSTKEPIRAALSGQLLAGGGRVLSSPGFLRFSGSGANFPDVNHARYYAQRMYEEGHLGEDDLQRLELESICMGDFFKQSILALTPAANLERISPEAEWAYPEFLQSFPAA